LAPEIFRKFGASLVSMKETGIHADGNVK